MTKEEIIKKYEMVVEGGELVAPFMGEDVKEVYEMLKAGLSALRPITREQLEKVWKGKWITKHVGNGWDDWDQVTCSVCGYHNYKPDFPLDGFCPMCGSAMTDKAVDMVMERLEALHARDT